MFAVPALNVQDAPTEAYGNLPTTQAVYGMKEECSMGAFEEMMQLIQRHSLSDHFPRIRPLVASIEAGILSKELAVLRLPEVRQYVEYLKDFPNNLHRPPADEQFNPQGPPPVSIGTLTETPVRFGLDPTNDIRHTLVSGASGFGKTVTLRCHILRLAEWVRP